MIPLPTYKANYVPVICIHFTPALLLDKMKQTGLPRLQKVPNEPTAADENRQTDTILTTGNSTLNWGR